MIVVCSACQARFKVADEKVGPRGAKVRCSKCQTVFVVHRELDALPSEAPPGPAASAAARPARGAFDLDLEAGPGKGSRGPPPAPSTLLKRVLIGRNFS